jgi:arylsulfatase A
VVQRLKQAGYATAVAGKWQLTLLKNDLEQPHRMGFDTYCLFGWHEGPRYYAPYIWQDGQLRKDVRERFGPEVYTDFLIKFMEDHRDGPFFAFYSMALCHAVSDDFKPPPPYGPHGRYDNFAEMMAAMDRYIGRLVTAVDKLELAKRTLIIFTTDNGSPSGVYIRYENNRYVSEPVVSEVDGAKIRGAKSKLTDWGIRVPTIARWPGTIAAGTTSDALIDFSDFYPTFIELAGLPAPDFPVNGHSFAPLLLGREYRPRTWVFSQMREKYCVRSQDWKLHHNGKLFHLATDPNEKKAFSSENDTPQSKRARGILRERIKALGVD